MELNPHVAPAISPPWRILGLQLKPLCIGHVLILQAKQSPFISEQDQPVNETDIIHAVAICSQTYEDARAFVTGEQPLRGFKTWLRKLFPRLSWFKKPVDWNTAAANFVSYIAEGIAAPKFWKDEDAKPALKGAHWSEYLTVSLLRLGGLSYSEAMNLPITRAWRLVLTNMEIETGRKHLVDPQDVEASKRANEFNEKLTANPEFLAKLKRQMGVRD